MSTALLVKILLFTGFFTHAQVGVNTTTAKTILGVTLKPANDTILYGIILPIITGDQLRTKNYTVNIPSPTENLDVDSVLRIRNLTENLSTNVINL
ncbi:hypothetical protein ACFOWU_12780 [Epilithonimonas zeae]|uniref:Uncharacterized protein n=1 Tax=Epilithonimonas zeae TaxID=1416779 RepID=A0A1N6J004_9FLAO|nr:hypothetical protein [Epilithonimonas zeae]SIO37577.1 hypothetical protein SAMN05444409_3171 [Epilithonimonas zeae]